MSKHKLLQTRNLEITGFTRVYSGLQTPAEESSSPFSGKIKHLKTLGNSTFPRVSFFQKSVFYSVWG